MVTSVYRVSALLLAGTLAVFVGASLALAAEVSVADLAKQLSAADLKLRYQAADELANRGAEAVEAIPELDKALGDPDPGLRQRAAEALGAIGPPAKQSAGLLVGRLKDENALVRAHAAHALGSIGAVNDAVVPELARTLGDADPIVRRAAIRALQKIRPGADVIVPLVTKLLEDNEPSVVLHALQSLSEIGDRAMPLIISALGKPKSCYWACVILSEMGPAAKSAVPALSRVLQDKDPEDRMQALIALGEIGPDAATAVSAITAALNDKEDSVAYAAAFALGKIGAKSATAALEKTVKDEDPFLAMISAWALAMINRQDEPTMDRAIEVLANGARHEKVFFRSAAVRGLAELKTGRGRTIPTLVAALKDPEPEVMANSLGGLVALGSAAVPELSKALADQHLQIPAAVALARIGPAAKGALPALMSALKSDNPEFHREAHFALAALGPEAAAAVPSLIKCLEGDDPEAKYSAAYALGKVGPAAKSAITVLKANVRSDDEFLRLSSVWALLAIVPQDKELAEMAVPLLTDALDDERPLVRREAATALGDLGARAKQAAPALQKSISVEPDPIVKTALEEALKRING